MPISPLPDNTDWLPICSTGWKRLCGFETHFLMGNDEHSQNVFKRASERGLAPLAYCDEMEGEFRSVWRQLGVGYDDFIRTTEPRHHRAAQEIWRRVAANGHIYKGDYEGWYCTVDEVFVPETQLVDGRCPICGNAVEKIAEESYFFKLSAYGDRLLAHYAANPGFVTPEKYLNEIVAFVKRGLNDLSISRTTFDWGVKVPDDPKHVMYVWFDALFNYLTAVEDQGREGRFWPPDVNGLVPVMAELQKLFTNADDRYGK